MSFYLSVNRRRDQHSAKAKGSQLLNVFFGNRVPIALRIGKIKRLLAAY